MTERDDIACRELVELATEYLEGSLPEARRARLEQHLMECDGCTNYLEQMRTTIRLTGRLSEEQTPPEAMDALLRAFRAAKRP